MRRWKIAAAWVGCLSAAVVTTRGTAAPRPASVPPRQLSSQPVGARNSAATLRTLDREVREYGVDECFWRYVKYEDGTLSGRDPDRKATGEVAVVDYHRPQGQTPDLPYGVEVWIQRRTGKRLIIRKEYLRAADLQMVQEAYDLTDYSRMVERVGDLFYITYSLRPLAPGWGALDGSVVVTLDAKTGKPADRIQPGW
jgi:hypothetical protein